MAHAWNINITLWGTSKLSTRQSSDASCDIRIGTSGYKQSVAMGFFKNMFLKSFGFIQKNKNKNHCSLNHLLIQWWTQALRVQLHKWALGPISPVYNQSKAREPDGPVTIQVLPVIHDSHVPVVLLLRPKCHMPKHHAGHTHHQESTCAFMWGQLHNSRATTCLGLTQGLSHL